METNQRVAAFITELRWSDLPESVQLAARRALLDTLGAALAGTLAPVSHITAEYAERRWPGDDATILQSGHRASAAGAAFANGYAANGIDVDDCGLYTKGHPGAQIVPTALALAESLHLSGAEAMTGLVVGYEVALRAARIWHATHETYQACGSWGSVACAAVSAHLMGLSAEATAHALGIAEYQAPNLPMMRDIDVPGMVKHGIGWGALTGIVSAELAKRGFTGVPSLFGLETYRDWASEIGETYLLVDGLARKRFACCAWVHAAILGVRRLRQQHVFTADEITRVRVKTFHEGLRLGTNLPSTTEEAQFNLAWPLAAFIVDGEVGPDQMLQPALKRTDIRRVADAIEVIETEALNRLYKSATRGEPEGMYASEVSIDLQGQKRIESGRIEGEINYPQGTWNEQELENKFRWLAQYVLRDATVDSIADAVSEFENVADVGVFCQLLVGDGRIDARDGDDRGI